MKHIEIISWNNYKNKQEWLDARAELAGNFGTETRIGASEIGTITGANPWKSLRRLTLEKAGLYSKEFINDSTTMGSIMEPIVAKWWEGYDADDYEQTQRNVTNGERLRKIKQAEFFLVNHKHPHLFISLDYVAEEPYYSPLSGRLVEGITPHEAKFINPDSYRTWGESGISLPYYQQVMIQCHVAESEFGIFLPLQHMGTKYSRIFNPLEIEYNKEYAEELSQQALDFCMNVTQIKILKAKMELSTDDLEIEQLKYEIEDLVPFDRHEDTVDVANEMHVPHSQELKKDIEDDSAEVELIESYLQWKDNETEVKGHLNRYKAELITASDGYEGFNHKSYSVTIRGDNSAKGKYFKVARKK